MNAAPSRGAHCGRDLQGNTQLDCDVVIVGSGAGGATMAAELAEAGMDVVIVEEGRHYRTEDFSSDTTKMVRAMYRGGGATMAFGDPPVFYQEGRTVGGSTVINGGMAFRPAEKVLERWSREHRVDAILPKDMDLYLARVEKRLHAGAQHVDTLSRDNEILKTGADTMGWQTVDNLRSQARCTGANNCAFGCPTGAKQSALVSYIPRALHFGARLYSEVKVTKITFKGTRATGIRGFVVNADGSRGYRVDIRAKLVVSSCGSIHTPALLSRSGVRSKSGRLGRDLTVHPNSKVVAFFDEEVRGWRGTHQSYQVREFVNDGILSMAAVNLPPAVLAMNLPCYGDELGKMMNDYNKMVVAGVMVEDTSAGRVRVLPGGSPQVFYQITDEDAHRLVKSTAMLCELLFSVGAQRILLPFAGVDELRCADDVAKLHNTKIPRSAIEVLSPHLMGTARMGGDPESAVTDSYGHVYGTERLVVADASLFPSCVGTNPAETIHALATRGAHYLIENQSRFIC